MGKNDCNCLNNKKKSLSLSVIPRRCEWGHFGHPSHECKAVDLT